MESVETLAIQTYQKNIEYLSSEHAELAKLLNIFESAINNGDYAPQYDLEYIDGYFDVVILKSKTYLYGSNSADASSVFTKMIGYEKNKLAFEGFPIYHIPNEQIGKLDDKEIGLKDIFPLMNYYSENSSETDSMKTIEKFIFVGTGLGMHIPMVNNSIDAQEYLIIEDDLEVFKLSLFTTPYYELGANKKLFFSIADDENEFLKKVKLFLENSFYENRYLKYFHFPKHSNNKIKLIQNALLTQNFVYFAYNHELKKYLRPLEYMAEHYATLNIGKNFDSSIFNEKPVLALAAGPSLEKNMEWLKANNDKFIIVAVEAVLQTLYKNNIKPDVIVHIDGFETSLVHYEDLPIAEFLKDTIVVLGAFTPTKVRNLFDKDKVFYFEESAEYIERFGSLVVPCVGSYALMLSLIFDAKELYLLGLDFAINQETGSTHSEGHAYEEQTDMDKKDDLSNTMEIRKNLFPVQGNFTNAVYTNSSLHTSVQTLYNQIPMCKREDQYIFNLNDGAKINKAAPKQVSEIDVNSMQSINKQELAKTLDDLFNNNSIKVLNDSDLKSMKIRLENAKNIHALIQEYSNSVSHSNVDRYFYDLLGLVSSILKSRGRENINLTQVYHSYFKYALPIISDLFNTKKLKNEKRHIKKIDKLLLNGMYDICNTYIEALEKFFNKS